MQIRYISCNPANPPSLLRKTLMVIGGLAVAGLALMFSAVVLGILLIAGALAWGYLWWQTRAVRKQFQQMQQMQNFPPRGAAQERDVFDGDLYKGEVIEGEAVRVDEPDTRFRR